MRIMKAFISATLLITLTFSQVKADFVNIPEIPDSLINTAINMIDQDSVESYVQSLEDMGTRFLIAPNRKDVALWIMNKFFSFGITEVRLDSFPCYTEYIYDTTTWQYNVEAKIAGSEFPDKEMIVMAHYDDYSRDSDPIFQAPGADDNASGTAAVLECARIIKEMNYQPKQTMIFLATAAEEFMGMGDSGAEHYAEEAEASERDIVMVINNDMIGWDDGTWTVQLINHISTTGLTDLAIEIITNFTTLNYQSNEPIEDVSADLQPFMDAGYQGIYFMEMHINPDYHTINDSISNLNFEYLAEVTGVSLGCLLHTDITVDTKEHDITPELSISPNPATDYFQIQTSSISIPLILKIYSIDGTLLISSSLVEPSTKVDISMLSPGVYVIVINSASETRYSRLIVN